ncbi:hypothetical protein HHI36_001610 [Cryptolaemus montrouzieri]|uniref:Uncharacterized protein n=1 Tax=Cryptolaemus montrouzieri TaxID=559131 RepID=A0ABD2P8A9_9CUCU
MIQESEELLEIQLRYLSEQEISSDKVPDITTQILTEGLRDKKENIIQNIDIVEDKENEKTINNEYCGDLISKCKRKSKDQINSDTKREWI